MSPGRTRAFVFYVNHCRLRTEVRPAGPDAPPGPFAGARSRKHSHHAGGRRRVRAPGDALLHRQGFVRPAAPGAEGVSSRADPLPAAPRRHHLQVQGDDRFPELVHQRNRRPPDRPHQRPGDYRRHPAVPGRDAALLRPAENEIAARRARGGELRCRLRRGAARRRALARQGAHLLAAGREGSVGPEASAARALEPAERPPRAGREHPRLPALELDRNRHLAVHPRRKHPHRAALFRQGARGRHPRQLAARCWSSRSCRCCPASGRRW